MKKIIKLLPIKKIKAVKKITKAKMSDELCQRLMTYFGEAEYDRFVLTFPDETFSTGTMKGWRKKMRIFADIKLNISIPDFIVKYKILRGGYYYWLELYYLFIKTK